MTIRYGGGVAVLLAAALLFLAACTQPGAPEPAEPPADAMPAAEPTALPASVQAAVDDFARQRAIIDNEWTLLHDDFDQWSAGLTACMPNAMAGALNDFAIEFNSVTEQARSLVRTQATGELADILIEAAEGEEAAFRQLRDHWQPNNVALFEQVEEQRVQAAHAQKEAEDRAIELRQTFEDAPDPETTREFSASFDQIKKDWGTIHDAYADLRDDAEDSEVDDVLAGLEEIAGGLDAVVDALGELPELDGAEDAVDALLDAAKAQRKAFRAAAKPPEAEAKPDASTSEEEAADAEDSADTEDATEGAEETEDTADTEATTDSAEDADAAVDLPDFEPLDEGVEKSETALKDAGRVVRSITDLDMEQNLADLGDFYNDYGRLRSQWNGFHARYNDWRKSEGGCDRAGAIAELDDFSRRSGGISRDVQALPQSGYLLPMYTLLAEAAAIEENALRTLRYTWQPFTIDAFKAVSQERTNADRLRREADIALQELRARY